MTPERMAALVTRWVRFYTRDLPRSIAGRRIEEIHADLHDHIADGRASGTSDPQIVVSILSRMVRGVAADVSWREQQARVAIAHPTPGGLMDTQKTAYRSAIGVAVASMLFLVWGVAAMGVIGAEGDPFDLMYVAVLAVGIVGAIIVRLQPHGMVRVLLAMAATQALIAVIALAVGKQNVPVSSVAEIVGLNGFYVALFVGAAWLFHRASRRTSSSS